MPDELARPTSSLLETLSSVNPFAALPAEWIGPAGFFCMNRSSLIKSNGSFCAQLKYWIRLGLQIEDGERIFQRLCHPSIARAHQYPNQLEVALAALVDEALRKRRTERDNQLRRESDAAAVEICKVADSFKGTH